MTTAAADKYSTDYIPTLDDLMPVMNFNAADIAANRTGELSQRQQQHFSKMRGRAIIIGGVLFFLLAFIATFLMFMGQQNETWVLGFLGVLVTISNAILMGMFGRHYMRLSADLRGGSVERVSGKMNRVVRPIGKVNNYHLRVDDADFVVDKDTFKLFRHEHPYHLYRAKQSGILLSAEPQG